MLVGRSSRRACFVLLDFDVTAPGVAEGPDDGPHGSLGVRGRRARPAAKVLYLAIRNSERKWKALPIQWRRALNQLDILLRDRLLQRVSYWSEWHPCC